jgi:exosome complex component RRP41
MQHTLATALHGNLLTHLYRNSTISVALHVLSQDGSLLAACMNAATLALIDAGVPMSDYLVACTAGINTTSSGAEDGIADPLLDLSGLEELELPFLTVGTIGATDQVSVLMMETRVRVEMMEAMLAVAIEGCKEIRKKLDAVVRAHGRKVIGVEEG